MGTPLAICQLREILPWHRVLTIFCLTIRHQTISTKNPLVGNTFISNKNRSEPRILLMQWQLRPLKRVWRTLIISRNTLLLTMCRFVLMFLLVRRTWTVWGMSCRQALLIRNKVPPYVIPSRESCPYFRPTTLTLRLMKQKRAMHKTYKQHGIAS